ncbi:ATP-binding protein [Streptomyces sp. NPDC003401]
MASSTTRHEGEARHRLRDAWRPIASTTGDPAYAGVFQRDDLAVRDARAMVRIVLSAWGLGQLEEDAGLLATELVANAVRHARGDVIRFTVTRTARYRVRVAVTDRSKQAPVLRPANPFAESGRGLHLVVALSSRWEVIPLPWGKQVWAEVGEA